MMSNDNPVTGENPIVTPTMAAPTTNPWLAPDISEPTGSTKGPRGADWPVGPPMTTTLLDPPSTIAPSGGASTSLQPSTAHDVDIADDMWWPPQTSHGAKPERGTSTRSWIIASVAAVAVTLLAIAGLNRASANSATAGGPGGRNGFPGGAGFPQNGGGFPGARQGGQNGIPNGAQPGGGAAPAGTSGSITAVTTDGFTLTEAGGRTVEVITSSGTQVIKIDPNAAGGGQGGVQAVLTDLKAGEQVTVAGDTANGTLTATFVLITG